MATFVVEGMKALAESGRLGNVVQHTVNEWIMERLKTVKVADAG